MNKPLVQVLVIAGLAVVLGVVNNLRPSAHIKWVQNWTSFQEIAEEAEEAPPEEVDDTELMPLEEVQAMVVDNIGMTTIRYPAARAIFEHARDMTLWIDGRDKAHYDEGRIEGSHHLYLYEFNEYFPKIDAIIQQTQPVALVVYCNGVDCSDSHHLAEELNQMGYQNIFIYKDGFDVWHEKGQPIEGTLAEAAGTEATGDQTAVAAKPAQDKPDTKAGMYLEHVIRDMVPFLFGLLLFGLWMKGGIGKSWVIAGGVLAGLFFIYAGVPKIDNPHLFAKSIWNYDIAPSGLINLSALIMPWLEVLAGLGLIVGLLRKGSSLVISGLLVIFIAAVSFNVLRGHDFNCGCTTTTTLITDVFLPGWNDKLLLVLRDIGLLVMSILAFDLARFGSRADADRTVPAGEGAAIS